MGISIYNIKKWTRMILGKSIYHVNQGVGKSFDLHEVRGYYNDLTEKVTKNASILYNTELPYFEMAKGKKVEFSIGIFQYGLGAYDLYLQTKEDKYLIKFKQCLEWAIEKQQNDGGWNSFSHLHPDSPYSAMAQGEGASLLIRAYKEFGDKKYLDAAINAIDFMLKPIEEGGTTIYKNDQVFLAEYTHLPVVLNGWIFALWGLYDLTLVDERARYKDIFERVCKTLADILPEFSCGYWSMYSLNDKITSPFYHRVHISQLNVMYQMTNIPVFKEYEIKWYGYSKNPLYKLRAFAKKAYQKIVE